MYYIWIGYNLNYFFVVWICSILNVNGRISIIFDIYFVGWVRVGGSNGFYCEFYGGGIYMIDLIWVCVYNGKQFYVSSIFFDVIYIVGGINVSGRIYVGGYLSINGGFVVSGIYGGLGVLGFNVYVVFQGRLDYGGIEVRVFDNIFGIGVYFNDYMYWWWGILILINFSFGKFYIMDYGGGNWSFIGNYYVFGYLIWGFDLCYKIYLGEVIL